MSLLTVEENRLIKGGSLIGSHKIVFEEESILIVDAGGIFTERTTKYVRPPAIIELVTPRLNNSLKWGVVIDTTDISVKLDMTIENIKKLINGMPKFEFEFKHEESINGIIENESYQGVKIDIANENLIIKSYSINFYEEFEIKLTPAFKYISIHTINRVEKNHQNIIIHYHDGVDNKIEFVIPSNRDSISLRLAQMIKQRENFFSNKENLFSVEVITEDMNERQPRYCYLENNEIKFYKPGEQKAYKSFQIENTQLFSGNHTLLLTDGSQQLIINNKIVKILCTKTDIVPKKLFEIDLRLNAMLSDKPITSQNIFVYVDGETFVFFNLETDLIIAQYNKTNLFKSKQNPLCMVSEDSIWYFSEHTDLLDNLPYKNTEKIIFSSERYPLYLSIEKENMIISVPDQIVYENKISDFYKFIAMEINDGQLEIEIPNFDKVVLDKATYKNLFKTTMYNLKVQNIGKLHSEKLLLSRARNMSDLLLFEFFGQWNLITEFVESNLTMDNFTEEEMTQHSLFLYHATFQQRLRMELLSNYFPQFMHELSKELMVDLKLNQIYQKQQGDMFQLSASLKSQFTELENLLSQVSYIHFNNNEYIKKLREQQQKGDISKLAVASAVGVGLTVMTGGFAALIFPALTVTQMLGSSKVTKLQDEQQREKEFKKNEFYFKKALTLIKHMSEHTMGYYTQKLNTLTYHNLRAEAEVLATENNEIYKELLLQQSLNIFTKLTLPYDYQNNVRADKIVANLLKPKQAVELQNTKQLFLD